MCVGPLKMHSMCLMYVTKRQQRASVLERSRWMLDRWLHDVWMMFRWLCGRIESHQTAISFLFHYFKWTDTFLSDHGAANSVLIFYDGSLQVQDSMYIQQPHLKIYFHLNFVDGTIINQYFNK